MLINNNMNHIIVFGSLLKWVKNAPHIEASYFHWTITGRTHCTFEQLFLGYLVNITRVILRDNIPLDESDLAIRGSFFRQNLSSLLIRLHINYELSLYGVIQVAVAFSIPLCPWYDGRRKISYLFMPCSHLFEPYYCVAIILQVDNQPLWNFI